MDRVPSILQDYHTSGSTETETTLKNKNTTKEKKVNCLNPTSPTYIAIIV